MDATLLWTAVGSGATAAGVVATVVIYRLQARSGRKPIQVELVASGGVRGGAGRLAAAGPAHEAALPAAGQAADGTGTSASRATGARQESSTVLRAPTGRLPGHVRGRDELLERLTRVLARPDGRVHVLAGLGGTGKSTIALTLAEAAAKLGIPAWWVPAVDAETMTVKLLELAEDLGAPPGEIAQAKAGQRNPADLLWRYLGQRGPWLLVFDNADDPAVLTVDDADAASGAGWLRPAPGMVVVTSRNREALTWGRHAELHPVGWLDQTDGSRVLTDLAPHAGAADEAAVLAERLGGLPLALHHAGSQLASEFAAESTFTGYLRSLNDRFAKLMGGGYPASGHGAQARQDDRAIVTSTWELSLDALAASGRPQARPLLRVLCCLAPAALIPARLLDVTVLARLCDDDEDRAADGLRALASVGLVTTSRRTDGASLGVTVHPLVSETSRLRLGTEDPARIGGTAVALLDAVADSLDADRPTDWPAWVQLVPHLNALYASVAAALADGDLSALAWVTEKAALAFNWDRQHGAELELAQSALPHVDRLGAEHEATLGLRFRIASAHSYLGQYEQAERDYRQVLEDQTRVLGPEHPNTLLTRYEIARVTAEQGRPEQAEHDYRQLLEDMSRVQGPDHFGTLATRYEIARVTVRQGRPEQAEHDYRQLLEDMSRVQGPDHLSTLHTRHDIAVLTAEQGRPVEAERDYRQLLEDYTRVLGPNHPSTLRTRHQIAAVLHSQGKVAAAREEFRAMLVARTRVLGSEHHDTRATASWLE